MKISRFVCGVVMLFAASGYIAAQSGTATGAALGFGGPISVTVTLEDGVITDVVIVGEDETPAFAAFPFAQMPGQMLEANTAQIDVFTGATVTSQAVIDAAQSALDWIAAGNAGDPPALWLAAGAPAPAGAHGTATGTATGVASGYGGPVSVTVTLENGNIVDVVISGPNETPAFANVPFMMAPGMIIAANSAQIDVFTGATITSLAIIEAAQIAINSVVTGIAAPAAPAGGIHFSGDASVGFRLHAPNVGSDSWEMQHRTEGSPVFNLTATAQRDLYGVRLDTTFRAAEGNELSINGIYGWVNTADNALRFTFGRISGNSAAWVTTLHSDHEWQFDAVTGARIQWNTPVQGLSVGAAVPMSGQDTERFVRQIIFGLNYFHPMFNTVLAYNLGGNTGVIFGVNYTGHPRLVNTGFQVRATSLALHDGYPVGANLELLQRVGFRVNDPLTVGLLTGQTVPSNVFRRTAPAVLNPEHNATLFFRPGATWRFSPTMLGLFDFDVSTPDHFITTNFELRPGLEFSLGGPATFHVEYRLGVSTSGPGQTFHTLFVGMDILTF